MCAVKLERKSPPEHAGAEEDPSAKRTCRRGGDGADTESASASSTNTTNNIMMPPRENLFNETTWWMVDLTPIGDSSSQGQGASALVKRCMREYSWDETKARKVLAAYRQFIILKKELKDWDANILSPCHLVDQMWHCHILDVVNYCHDMMMLCGHGVGHNPDGALDYVGKKMRDEATRVSLLEYFGRYDGEVWKFSQDMISIRIKLGRVETVLEEVTRTTRMQDVFRRYAATKVQITLVDHLSFRLNNERIHGNQTVADLGLEENDLIHCMLESPSSINLRFRAYNRDDFTIDVQRTDTLRQALREYRHSSRIGRDEFVRRFVFIRGKNQVTVHPHSTPESLQMTDHNVIYCYIGSLNDHDAQITIRLKDTNGEETMFTILTTTPMRKVFNAYAGRKGVSVWNIRFLLNGERMDPNMPPAYFNLEDNDQIDCSLQLGGC